MLTDLGQLLKSILLSLETHDVCKTRISMFKNSLALELRLVWLDKTMHILKTVFFNEGQQLKEMFKGGFIAY